MTAPFPTPQYIDIGNVQPLIGLDKVKIGDGITNAIPLIEANALIAKGEGDVLLDLSPYYVTVPNLVTPNIHTWVDLPSSTYSFLYNMFVYRAAYQIIGNYIARNTDQMDKTLSYFQNFYGKEYEQFIARLRDKLPNGSYRYELLGLLPSNGIPRRPARYAITGNLGNRNYVDNQVTNPAINFGSGFYYRNGYNRNGGFNQ